MNEKSAGLIEELSREKLLQPLPKAFLKDLAERVVVVPRGERAPSPKKLARLPVHGEEFERAALEWRARGDVIVRQGTYDADVHVVLSGVVDVRRRAPGGKVTIIDSLGPETEPNWFGEMTALSNRPQHAECVATTDCQLLTISALLFKKFYSKPKFKQVVLESYRKTGLPAQLRSAPLFEGLDEREIRRIARRGEFVTLGRDEVIADAEGAGGAAAEADAFYFVLSGVVKWLVRDATGGERFQAALCDNSSFGERTLAASPEWRGRYVTETEVDLLRIPRDTLERLGEETLGKLRRNAERLKDREEGKALVSAAGRFLVKAGRALVIDLERCTRCNACVESCVAVHEDRVPRISKRGIRDHDERGAEFMLTSACYHCERPDCMMSCNFGAIRRTLGGEIDFVYDACTGCQKCEEACPYDVIRMADVAESAGGGAGGAECGSGSPPSIVTLLLRGLLGRGGEQERHEEEAAGRQKSIKCDLCAGLPFEACVYNCPYNAIERYSPAELDARGLFR